jgi:flavin reductase (DIM6/NTAB) family NADH-FMN oxidoreductase RutF
MKEEKMKLDMGTIEAVMSLPPAPVMLLAVGEVEQNVTTIGMFNVFSVDPTIVGLQVQLQAPGRDARFLAQRSG